MRHRPGAAAGVAADVVVSTVDPLTDLAALADPAATLTAVVCRGRIVLDRSVG